MMIIIEVSASFLFLRCGFQAVEGENRKNPKYFPFQGIIESEG